MAPMLLTERGSVSSSRPCRDWWKVRIGRYHHTSRTFACSQPVTRQAQQRDKTSLYQLLPRRLGTRRSEAWKCAFGVGRDDSVGPGATELHATCLGHFADVDVRRSKMHAERRTPRFMERIRGSVVRCLRPGRGHGRSAHGKGPGTMDPRQRYKVSCGA
ncbi:hypothetical protein T440DRAFT_124388 [Plenodomus tracheiphilus IPT5]|uniref:Uncharacterized protein n=1 Tax=Plenodomus tracheiphilus IPT5 TaxID=1408161 RepID=A0A6A7B5J0_9PLEO|nr:hypothetical protein T440DRAFT_124388 [Plenodomus tracheiphilus IPT5]